MYKVYGHFSQYVPNLKKGSRLVTSRLRRVSLQNSAILVIAEPGSKRCAFELYNHRNKWGYPGHASVFSGVTAELSQSSALSMEEAVCYTDMCLGYPVRSSQ